MKKVVVVESPAKAKTIHRYLGNEFEVFASYGHIRDLPSKNGSVDPTQAFAMTWETDPKSVKHIGAIGKALRQADALYLATDPDREGEAISWHVHEVLKEQGFLSDQTVHRIVFHEITKKAVQQALKSPRDIDQPLVEAYLARRALDYLVGFTLSPVLWRKLPGSRSAGRVQSVALRLVVSRENEIEAFTQEEYWSVWAEMRTPTDQPYLAKLTHLFGKKLEKMDLRSAEEAAQAQEALLARSYTIQSIEKKQVRRNPAAPFITSTLQQEASRKLGLSVSRTMQIAQKLYEGIDIGGEVTGLITYMRTDSVSIAQEAIGEIRDYIHSHHGPSYVPSQPREFKSKSKNAQEAHEAIRPTSVGRHPRDLAPYLEEMPLKLYDLIWRRSVASQMESALFDQVTISIGSPDDQVRLRAGGSTLAFDGFLALYQESKDEEGAEEEGLLPLLTQGGGAQVHHVTPKQHFTEPPPRYTEASLVKKMEELGIGRPSTYASILNVLQERHYVKLEKRQFTPESRGRLVTSFLVNFFKRYVEYDFTAHLEEELDEISQGARSWRTVLTTFWEPFKATVEGTKDLRITEVLDSLEQDLSLHLFQSEESRQCPKCTSGRLGLKLSRYGSFIGCSGYPECGYTRPMEGEEALTDQEMKPHDQSVSVGIDPVTGAEITLRKGPYGLYLQWEENGVPSREGQTEEGGVQEERESSQNSENPEKKGGKTKKSSKKTPKPPKPKRISLPPPGVGGLDPNHLTLDQAMALKVLPKAIGAHPHTQEKMSIGLGRFGPYVKCGDLFASIPKTEDFLSLGFDRALELVEIKRQKVATGRPSRYGPKKS